MSAAELPYCDSPSVITVAVLDHVPGTVDSQKEKTVIRSTLALLEALITLRNLYLQLFKHVAIFWFYIWILSLHFKAQDSFPTVSSLAERVLPPQRGVEFMDWFKTMIWTVWDDNVCGDGICVPPHEFPSFGRFGCQADCGNETDVATVMIYFEVGFFDVHDQTISADTANDLRKSCKWNVCMRDESRMAKKLPEVCWYENEQSFTQTQYQHVEALSLRQVQYQLLQPSNTPPRDAQSPLRPEVPLSFLLEQHHKNVTVTTLHVLS
ncbi:TRP-like ion channel Pkd2 [Cymbomonas tetramitiformis]|uniref:TRP-like ion channel Pkd2 n=1 Tax=Cymbomonas tetramitiformis TaxID=36881 RepID=A0AAE0F5U8_9CHLO|nr:TRP-like ion channel Pkd2 [Cymbomonas tetramitiformis]